MKSVWHFYVNKSNEETRQVFRSKEIIQNSKKSVILLHANKTRAKSKSDLTFFTEFSISIRTSKHPEFDYEFIALLIRISFDFANISNGEFLPKIAAKLKMYSILFTFRLTAGLFDQRVRSI